MKVFYNDFNDIWSTKAYEVLGPIFHDVCMIGSGECSNLNVPYVCFNDCIIGEGESVFEVEADIEKIKRKFLLLTEDGEDVVFLVTLEWNQVDIRYKNGLKNIGEMALFCKWLQENRKVRIHLLVKLDTDIVDNTYVGFLSKTEGWEYCDSIAFMNTNGIIGKNEGLYGEYIEDDDTNAASKILCERALEVISAAERLEQCRDGEIYVYNHKEDKYVLHQLSEQDKYQKYWQDEAYKRSLDLDKYKLCSRLKQLQMEFAEKYGLEYKPVECYEENCCNGNCAEISIMQDELFVGVFGFPKYLSMYYGDPQLVPVRGVYKFGEGCYGKGMRNLIVLNDCCLDFQKSAVDISKKDFLFCRGIAYDDLDALANEKLYYYMTRGGITLGFGEPLLYPDFICQTYRAGMVDSIDVITSLNVPLKAVQKAAAAIDEWFIDVLDMNTEIYKKLTGKDNLLVYRNLAYLLENFGPDKIYVYLPLLEGYNTEQDVERSIKILKLLGVRKIVRGSAVDPKLFSLAVMNKNFAYKKLLED